MKITEVGVFYDTKHPKSEKSKAVLPKVFYPLAKAVRYSKRGLSSPS
jgi:hypothetical protein